ncbi:SpoIID/LytB domain-containing protein [Microlunatus ginsengisoli]|uniref:Sporulation stage II protein D amidase enhancer LytB N-terminal domain-containing protein n=1 Tax=Microlunatus ginsengisoli TaxID=363863 RepID=A0ABP6ZWW8_9ACTN
MPPTTPSPMRRTKAAPLRLLTSAAGTAAMVASAALVAPPAAVADSAVAAAAGSFTVRGSGFGHGWGMSQYGAYGAAVKGQRWQQILAFYYPGTTRSTLSQRTIRVWVTADSDSDLRLRPAKGLKITSGSKSYTLPAGSAYKTWRVSRSGSGYKLQYQTSSGAWKARSTGLGTGTWTASNSAGIVTVIMPGGSRREYRGTVSLIKRGSGGRTVNTVSMENYVRSVVPSEMPTSWALEAVKAQAVAARTYAAKLRSRATSSGYDICDTTACQVYSGYARTVGGKRSVRETARGNAAAQATANVILTYKGTIALTQFASSNGGATAKGDYAYLKAHSDPYDGVIKSQAWSKKITAAAIGKRWSVGTVRGVQITTRDGSGAWGGRVTRMKIIGSKKTVTITGGAFKSAFGLRSSLFTLGGAAGTPAGRAGTAYAAFPRTYEPARGPEVLIIAANGTLRRYPVSTAGLGTAKTLGSGFDDYTNVVNLGDWNGDGYQDILGRTDADQVRLLRTSAGSLTAAVVFGQHTDYRAMTGVGDLSRDGRPDLVVLTRSDTLWLLPSDGRTGRRASVRLATGWKSQDLVRGIGDLTGDGMPDLVARSGDRLYLYAGTRNGIRSAKLLGTGWAKYSSITSVGDLNRDGRADLIARTGTGSLVLFLGTSAGTLGAGKTIATGFKGTRFGT